MKTLAKKSSWISVKDGLPIMGELVVVISGISAGFIRYIEPGDFERLEIDYWMSLPEYPEEILDKLKKIKEREKK